MLITWMTIVEDTERKTGKALTKDEIWAIRVKLCFDRQGNANGMALAPWRKWAEYEQPREKYLNGDKNRHDYIPRRD